LCNPVIVDSGSDNLDYFHSDRGIHLHIAHEVFVTGMKILDH